MFKLKKELLFFIFVLILINIVDAATYYVATTGNDLSGDGSINNPWATINNAASSIPDDGSNIIVKDGTYMGTITITRRFVNSVKIMAENQYKAILIQSNQNSHTVIIVGATNLTFSGFEITRAEPYEDPPDPLNSATHKQYLIQISNGGVGQVYNINITNNIIHDNSYNDLLKINDRVNFVYVSNNVFYNQGIVGDQHMDINTVTDVDVTDNIMFNDFQGSGRTNPNAVSGYIVIKHSGTNPNDGMGKRFKVQRNIFLNWEGQSDKPFILLGEDGYNFYEAEHVLIENNLMLGNSLNNIVASVNYKGVRNITFRANTIVGNLPGSSYAARINLEGSNLINTDLYFYNNIWSDPTGTMNRFSIVANGHAQNILINNNLYWNNGNTIPTNDALLNINLDANSITGNPILPSQGSIILPRWNRTTGAFLSGSNSIREEFKRLVMLYGKPGVNSLVIDSANSINMPQDDILGNNRNGKGIGFDIGAYELSNCPDSNNDGIINVKDLALEGFWQGYTNTYAQWNNIDHLDLNADNRIDVNDINIVISSLGSSC